MSLNRYCAGILNCSRLSSSIKSGLNCSYHSALVSLTGMAIMRSTIFTSLGIGTASSSVQTRAQLRLQAFAGGMALGGPYEVPGAGQLVGGEPRAAELPQRCGIEPCRPARRDRRDQLLAEPGMGHAEGRRFQHLRMLQQHALDFGTIDILAAADDHVGLAPDDVQKPLAIDAADVAAVQPAVAHPLGIRRRAVPVTVHVLRAADAHFPAVARPHLAPGLVDDADLRGRQRAAGAVG